MSWLRPLVFVALASAFLLPAPQPAAAGSGTIQPGDFVNVGGAGCTLNFVYDGTGALAGKLYVGTAAHCVGSVGQSASTSGYANFGTVAFIGDACCSSRDYAFIEVKPAYDAFVSPAVRGHPTFPTGGFTTPTDTAAGDPVYISGQGGIFSVSAVVAHQRVGALVSDSTQIYQIAGPIYYGDSGGPIVHVSGKALGIVSRGIPPAYDEGPTVQRAIVDAAARGFTVSLRTV